MATVSEAYRAETGSDGTSPTVDVSYFIFDAGTLQEAMSALFAATPASFDVYGDVSLVLPKAGISVERAENDLWNGVVNYAIQAAPPISPPEGAPEYGGDANGGTHRVLRGIATVNRYPNAVSQPALVEAPDQHGFIGVTKDGIEGVDLIIPGFNWTETHYLSKAVATWTYLRTVSEMRGTVNSAPFRGFAAGEVLLADFSWAIRGSGDVQVSFAFVRIPNKANFAIDTITGIDKNGHEYLWTFWQDKVETGMVQGEPNPVEVGVVREPRGVYVEKVYELADFSLLSIGTGAPSF